MTWKLQTIINKVKMMKNWKDPIHPGEILADELEAIGINVAELAIQLDVPKNRMYQIVNGKRGITADTAIRLGIFFGTGPNVWLNLQKSYELDVANRKVGKGIKNIVPYQQENLNR